MDALLEAADDNESNASNLPDDAGDVSEDAGGDVSEDGASATSSVQDPEADTKDGMKEFGEMLGVADDPPSQISDGAAEAFREPSEVGSKRSLDPDECEQRSTKRRMNLNNDFLSSVDNDKETDLREPFADNYRYAELSHEEINVMKLDLLYKINMLNEAGFDSPKTFTIEDSLVALEAEHGRLHNLEDLQYGIKMMRYVLTNGVSLIESVNENFRLSPLKLKGWSVAVHRDVNKYNPILMELYQQHAYAVQLSPLTKLCIALGFSAASTHLANSLRSAEDETGSVGGNMFASVLNMFGGTKRNKADASARARVSAPGRANDDDGGTQKQPQMHGPPAL